MWKVSAWIGYILGSISIVSIIVQIFSIGLYGAFELIYNYYNILVTFLLGWAETPIEILLRGLSKILNIKLEIFPHWKHVFVLMVLYFGAEIKTDFGRQRIISAYSGTIVGFVISVVSSISAGTIPLSSNLLNLWAVVPSLCGFVSYALFACVMTSTYFSPTGQSWSNTFKYYLKTTLLPYLTAATAAVLFGFVYSNKVIGINILCIAFFIFVVTVYWISRGLWLAVKDRTIHEKVFNRFRRTGGAKFAKNILVPVGGAGLYILLNAGLTLGG